MTAKEEKRIFIGGLVKGVTEQELKEKFSRFGQVGQIEIKTRVSGIDSRTFAHLNLTAEDNDFKKCFTAYNNTKWKGGQLKLQFAKQSFLSKLKEEQAEAQKESEKKQSKQETGLTSPALEEYNKKAVPGTPMDEKGTWVMGKYSRVLPVLHMKKPSSRKVVTLDPSKMTHSLKKLKCDDSAFGDDAALTWQMEENDSEMTKKRKGEFPSKKAPRKESVFSRLQELARQEHVSDTEMEVVPVGSKLPNLPAANSYHSDSADSAGTDDTDEIISKASHQKSAPKSPSSGSVKKKQKKGSRVKASRGKDPMFEGSDSSASSVEDSPSTISSVKKLQSDVKASTVRKQQPVNSFQSDSDDSTEGQGPQFQFAKTDKVQGKCFKKSAKMSQPKTPPFKGLSMLSSDDESDDESEKGKMMKTSTPSSERKPQKANSRSKTIKTPELSCVAMPSSEDEDKLPLVPAHQRESGQLLTSSIKPNQNFGEAASFSNSSKSKQQPWKSVNGESIDTDNTLSVIQTPTRKRSTTDSAQQQGLNKLNHDEFASGIVDDLPRAASSQALKKPRLCISDDSDLDDNDFELVGKRLAARANQHQSQERSGNSDKRGHLHVQASAITGTPGIKDTKAKKSLREEKELTSIQKSHEARKKNQEEMKKMENIITKSIREGTHASKHVKFPEEEEDEPVQQKSSMPKKLQLLEDCDSEDEEEGDFSIRPQFEGKKGLALMELQSKFKDKRFRIDERFASSDSDINMEEEKMEQDPENEALAEEKARNLKILQDVLGYMPRQRKKIVYEDMSQRRYMDPQRSSHLEMKEKKVENRKAEKDKEKKDPPTMEKEENNDEEDVTTEEERDEEKDRSEEEEEEKDRSEEGEKEKEKFYSEIKTPQMGNLFSVDSAFTFFSDAQNEIAKSQSLSDGGDDDDDDGDDDDDDDDDDDEEEEEEMEEEEQTLPASSSSITTIQRDDQQPSFMVARDNPRILAAVRFFKRPPQEEFEEFVSDWAEERKQIMMIVRERHKKKQRKDWKRKQIKK